MDKFKKSLLRFVLLMLLINGLIFIVKFFLFNDYYKHSTENNSYLLADSHGWYLGKATERIGVTNFSYYSDSYIDTERKLNYLIGRGEIDTVYISADDHTLSPYRDFSNNEYKSVKYEYTQGEYEISDFALYKLQHYVVLFDPNIRAIISHFFNEQSERLLGFDKNVAEVDDLPWERLSEEERVSLSEERFSEQFPDMNGSDDLEESLLNIVELCEKNNITLIGIKFPLADEYSKLIGEQSYEADSILFANGIKIYDFRDIFHNDDSFFEDPDHINSKGALKLIDSIKILNFDETLTFYENSSIFNTNAPNHLELLRANKNP
ncbi:MAG: hypothetical protein PHV12_03385 [Bacteroidales bacterium]|jgi:hypothetical protein|nr:hypothetical protein [Bacteroidales bacterium]MDD4058758.1 hypothetical protein [Bacteroidales bacterium]